MTSIARETIHARTKAVRTPMATTDVDSAKNTNPKYMNAIGATSQAVYRKKYAKSTRPVEIRLQRRAMTM